MSPNAKISVQIKVGTNIDQACASALAIATKLECYVGFIFNGQEIVVNPEHKLFQIIAIAHKQLSL